MFKDPFNKGLRPDSMRTAMAGGINEFLDHTGNYQGVEITVFVMANVANG